MLLLFALFVLVLRDVGVIPLKTACESRWGKHNYLEAEFKCEAVKRKTLSIFRGALELRQHFKDVLKWQRGQVFVSSHWLIRCRLALERWCNLGRGSCLVWCQLLGRDSTMSDQKAADLNVWRMSVSVFKRFIWVAYWVTYYSIHIKTMLFFSFLF